MTIDKTETIESVTLDLDTACERYRSARRLITELETEADELRAVILACLPEGKTTTGSYLVNKVPVKGRKSFDSEACIRAWPDAVQFVKVGNPSFQLRIEKL